MKVRLTPLNIFTSVLLVSIAYLFIYRDSEGWRMLGSVSLLVMAVLSFFTDLIFRKFIKDLKRIWIIELLFIIFAAVLMLLFGRI
ncbi:MAG: hypothetical protein H7Y13_06520 [Sphingobacteriaceae bacterium]|nr:hypothetical protein [Sphingobacteriaceae bacterium]